MKSISYALLCWLTTSLFYTPLEAQPGSDTLSINSISLDSLLNIQVSSATRYLQNVREAPASISLVTREDIQNFGYNDLSELLNSLAGIYISNDRGYNYLGVRGFSRPTDYSNRILILVDGHAVNENVWGGAPLGEFFRGMNLDNIERVEVIRGPASALYGNYSMLATINIVTRDAKQLNGGDVSLEAGSFGKLQGSLAYGRELGKDWSFELSGRLGSETGQALYYPEYDTPDQNNGIADKLDFREYHSVHGKIRYKNFQLHGGRYDRSIGVPTGAYEVLFNDSRAQFRDLFTFAELGWQEKLNPRHELKARIYGDHYKYRGVFPYDFNDGGVEFDEALGWWAGGEVIHQWDVSPKSRIVSGVEVQHHLTSRYTAGNQFDNYYDENKPFTVASLFFENRYRPLKWLSLLFGARYDYNTRVVNYPIPKLDVLVDLPDGTIFKVLMGNAFRVPSTNELFSTDNRFYKGNEDLRPERLSTIELRAEKQLNKNNLVSVSTYWSRFFNLIDQELDPTDSLLQFQNRDKVRAGGFEFSYLFKDNSGFSTYANYALTFSRNQTDDIRLTNFARHMAKFGISVPFFRHFRFSWDAVYETGRKTVYDTETDPYLLSNVNFIISPHFNWKNPISRYINGASLSFQVRNLFDQEYAHPGGFEHLQEAIVQNGRNYNIKFRLRF